MKRVIGAFEVSRGKVFSPLAITRTERTSFEMKRRSSLSKYRAKYFRFEREEIYREESFCIWITDPVGGGKVFE